LHYISISIHCESEKKTKHLKFHCKAGKCEPIYKFFEHKIPEARSSIARYVYRRNLVDIFYHICQVAARIAQLVMRGAFGTSFGEWQVVGGQRW